MRAKKRGKKGEVHVFQPAGSATFWVRYTVNGERKRQNTGKTTEGEARIFAAQVGRMVGLANSDNLDEKRRLLEIARELLRGMPELEAEAAHLTATKSLPSVREWFTRELDAMRQNASGDDRELKAVSIARVGQVVDDFLAFLKGQTVDLAAAPLNRIGPDDVKAFLADYKTKGYSGKSRLFARDRIRAILGHAVDKGLLPVNPASVRQLGRLKFDAGSIRQPFTDAQLAAVIEAAANFPERWVYLSAMLALFTGQRAGDIVAMRWEDVKDFDGTLPTVALTQQKTGNALVIPIAEPLRRALRAVPKAAQRLPLGRTDRRRLRGPVSKPLSSPLARFVERGGVGRHGGRADAGQSGWQRHAWPHPLRLELPQFPPYHGHAFERPGRALSPRPSEQRREAPRHHRAIPARRFAPPEKATR
jgi:integrase